MNKVILIGNVVKTPDVRYTASGEAIVNLTIATNKRWKDKDGNKKESVEFHKISAFEPRSKILSDYVKKGSKLCIMGELKTRKWQDKNGTARYTTEIICNEIELLSGASRDDTADDNDEIPKPEAKKPTKDEYEDDILF